MIRRVETYPPEVNGLLNGSGLMFRLPLPDGSPHVDDSIAGMFRALGQVGGRLAIESNRYDDIDPAPLAPIAQAEREALLVSISTTVARASYHHQRYHFLVCRLLERRRLTGFGSGHDSLTRFAVFEAAAMLGAIRGAVDEVVFVGARRSGASGEEEEGWKAHRLITARALYGDKDIADVRALREHTEWFLELNDYRNALFHRGSKQTTGTGYYPPGDPFPEADDADFNVFLVPDRGSIRRQARPHLWTYVEKLRLEDLVGRAWAGFQAMLLEIGALWGGLPSPPGRALLDEYPNLIIGLPQPAFYLGRDDTAYAGIFTSRNLAEDFMRSFSATEPVGPILPVRRCRLGNTSRFFLSVPTGRRIADDLPAKTWVKFPVDPTWDPKGKTIDFQRELGNINRATLMADAKFDNLCLEIPGEVFPDLEEVFVIHLRIERG